MTEGQSEPDPERALGLRILFRLPLRRGKALGYVLARARGPKITFDFQRRIPEYGSPIRGALSSGVEHMLHTHGVTGSNPVARTTARGEVPKGDDARSSFTWDCLSGPGLSSNRMSFRRLGRVEFQGEDQPAIRCGSLGCQRVRDRTRHRPGDDFPSLSVRMAAIIRVNRFFVIAVDHGQIVKIHALIDQLLPF